MRERRRRLGRQSVIGKVGEEKGERRERAKGKKEGRRTKEWPGMMAEELKKQAARIENILHVYAC